MFESCRKVLNGKAIELREKGLGKARTNLTHLHLMKKNYESWSNNHKSLNYTAFYLISQQFSTRGCQEHHQLWVEELKFVYDSSGETIQMEWVEGFTKTIQGGANLSKRLPQKMFTHEGNTRCPS